MLGAMDTHGFEELFGTLDRERQQMAARLETLRREVVESEQRMRDLDAVIAGLQRLDLVPTKAELEPSSVHVPAVHDEPSEEEDPGALESTASATPPRQRIRSTEMVADVVNRAVGPLTRDEVVEKFRVEVGFPASWANPRNAIGNALGRATSRGWVTALDGDRFAPLGWVEARREEAAGHL